jgi:hypothetical protein
MNLPLRPRLVRTGQDLTLTRPMAYTRPSDRAIGGGETSAAGVPSRYVIVWLPRLYVTLEFTEAEWPNVSAFLRAVDAGALAWTFYPDAAVATSHTVYLESPSVANDEAIEPQRLDGYPFIYRLPLILRRTTSTVWDVRHG